MKEKKRPFVICSSPRSGSYLVCNILEQTGLTGIPAEYFTDQSIDFYIKKWEISSFSEYIDVLPWKASEGAAHYGVKIMAQLWPAAAKKIRKTKNWPNLSDDEVLFKVFPGAKFIFLNRQDKIRQAVSLYKAQKTGIWAIRKPEHEERNSGVSKIEFSYNQIAKLRDMLISSDFYWTEFFKRNEIQFYSLSFEDFVSDKKMYSKQIFDYIGLPETTPVPEPSMKKQSSKIDKELYSQFRKSSLWREPIYKVQKFFESIRNDI